jgi:hypothetical protein
MSEKNGELGTRSQIPLTRRSCQQHSPCRRYSRVGGSTCRATVPALQDRRPPQPIPLPEAPRAARELKQARPTLANRCSGSLNSSSNSIGKSRRQPLTPARSTRAPSKPRPVREFKVREKRGPGPRLRAKVDQGLFASSRCAKSGGPARGWWDATRWRLRDWTSGPADLHLPTPQKSRDGSPLGVMRFRALCVSMTQREDAGGLSIEFKKWKTAPGRGR